jgi:hypothetical protein
MKHRRLAKGALGLAGFDQVAELPPERVIQRFGRFLVLEQPDAERVGGSFLRAALAEAGAHRAAV